MVEYKLKKPINKVTGEKIESVELRDDFSGDDLEKVGNARSNGGDGTSMIQMVACATGLAVNVVKTMASCDIIAISGIVQPFFGDGEA